MTQPPLLDIQNYNEVEVFVIDISGCIQILRDKISLCPRYVRENITAYNLLTWLLRSDRFNPSEATLMDVMPEDEALWEPSNQVSIDGLELGYEDIEYELMRVFCICLRIEAGQASELVNQVYLDSYPTNVHGLFRRIE